jgi:hypothetical protein
MLPSGARGRFHRDARGRALCVSCGLRYDDGFESEKYPQAGRLPPEHVLKPDLSAAADMFGFRLLQPLRRTAGIRVGARLARRIDLDSF